MRSRRSARTTPTKPVCETSSASWLPSVERWRVAAQRAVAWQEQRPLEVIARRDSRQVQARSELMNVVHLLTSAQTRKAALEERYNTAPREVPEVDRRMRLAGIDAFEVVS